MFSGIILSVLPCRPGLECIMRSTRFWIVLFSLLLALAAAVSLPILNQKTQGTVANIYREGVCLKSIDLSQVAEGFSLQVEGRYQNTISVEPGRICVEAASCPDQICVHQGWISNSVAPIVCLPNSLVIQLETAPGRAPDAVTY